MKPSSFLLLGTSKERHQESQIPPVNRRTGLKKERRTPTINSLRNKKTNRQTESERETERDRERRRAGHHQPDWALPVMAKNSLAEL